MLRLAARALVLSLAGCGAATAVPARPPPASSSAGHALALGYGGRLDTDVSLDELFARDFTLMAWVLPEHPHAYAGPVFAENGGGSWAFGQGDYRSGDGGYRKVGPPVLALRAGDAHTVASPDRDILPGEWRHIAVVRRGERQEIYVDGARVGELFAPVAAAPHGTLRIGRRTDGQPAAPARYEGQFYGLVDDVAIYSRALAGEELLAAAQPAAHPGGDEPGLVAAYTFEEPAAQPRLARPTQLAGAAARVPVSGNRDGARDAAAIPLPAPKVPMRLPFDAGDAWRVMQGNASPGGSHNGYAAFSWDFALAGKPLVNTRGRTARACAPGEVVLLQQGAGNNHLMVKQADHEFAAYMHLVAGSIRGQLGLASLPKAGPGPTVRAGQPLGLVGDTGAGPGNYHLHVSVSDRGAHDRFMVTIPIAFSDYEVSRDEGRTWTKVPLGVPKQGQWIRNPR